MFVIDASAMLAWCFIDETPKNGGALLARLERGGLCAPAHWPLEVVNILWMAERKGRATAVQVTQFLDVVDGLGVQIDAETPFRAWIETRALAMAEGLTSYDAAYLELAMRLRATLVSKDSDLLAAASRLKVSVLDLSV